MSKILIDRFNKPDTYLIISGYPERFGHGNNYGISWYTKETIEPIAKKKNARFVVLAETNHNNDPHMYQDGKILVLRVFDQRHISVYPRIFRWLKVFSKVKHVYVHSEFCANGGIKNFSLLLPFLLLIRLTGRHITFFAHNFVTSFDTIATHLNFEKGSWKLKILNLLLRMYNHTLGLVVDRVVVMDDAIKHRAQQYIPKSKIISMPFFIKKPANVITKEQAREKLNIPHDEFVILYFGFVTWYKGADWIIKKIQKLTQNRTGGVLNKKIRLIIAGGEAYSLREKPYYIQYFKNQLAAAAKNKHITITGFVPEEEVGTYFQAADIAVFPYRGLIGASGALTYAMAHNKPFLISTGLQPLLHNEQAHQALDETGLTENDITFSLKGRSFELTLEKTIGNIDTLQAFSTKMAKLRTYDVWIDRYHDSIFKQPKQKMNLLPNFAFSPFSK